MNNFDILIKLIDDNIEKSKSEIKEEIKKATTYNSRSANTILSFLTNGKHNLESYILERKLYYAIKKIQNNHNSKITEVASTYGFSHSKFDNYIKGAYGYSPSEIRKCNIEIPDTRLSLLSLSESSDDKYSIIDLQEVEHMIVTDLEEFEFAKSEYNFDIDTCYAIKEVADRINIPFLCLLNKCYDAMIDIHSDSDFVSPRIEKAIELGVTNEDELNSICEYFECNYMDLNSTLVQQYKNMQLLNWHSNKKT